MIMVHFNSKDLSQVKLAAQGMFLKHARMKSNIQQSNVTQHYTSNKSFFLKSLHG